MPTFNQLENESASFDNGVPFEYSKPAQQTNLLAKVFLVMFVSLLLTGVVSYISADMLLRYFATDIETFSTALMVSLFGSMICLFVLAIILPRQAVKSESSILPGYIFYCLFMSIFLSSLFLLYDLSILAITFGITGVVFGIMALLGLLSKGSLSPTIQTIIGLIVGSIILALVNLFLRSDEISWIVSFIVLAIVLLFTMYDVRRIKEIINYGYANNSKNMALYCSMILYADFINLFIRLLPYIARIAGNKK